MAGCNRMAGLSDGFQVRVSISTTEINTQTHHILLCTHIMCTQGPVQRINADMLMLNGKGQRMGIFFYQGFFFFLRNTRTFLYGEYHQYSDSLSGLPYTFIITRKKQLKYIIIVIVVLVILVVAMKLC